MRSYNYYRRTHTKPVTSTATTAMPLPIPYHYPYHHHHHHHYNLTTTTSTTTIHTKNTLKYSNLTTITELLALLNWKFINLAVFDLGMSDSKIL